MSREADGAGKTRAGGLQSAWTVVVSHGLGLRALDARRARRPNGFNISLACQKMMPVLDMMLRDGERKGEGAR